MPGQEVDFDEERANRNRARMRALVQVIRYEMLRVPPTAVEPDVQPSTRDETDDVFVLTVKWSGGIQVEIRFPHCVTLRINGVWLGDWWWDHGASDDELRIRLAQANDEATAQAARELEASRLCN